MNQPALSHNVDLKELVKFQQDMITRANAKRNQAHDELVKVEAINLSMQRLLEAAKEQAKALEARIAELENQIASEKAGADRSTVIACGAEV